MQKSIDINTLLVGNFNMSLLVQEDQANKKIRKIIIDIISIVNKADLMNVFIP